MADTGPLTPAELRDRLLPLLARPAPAVVLAVSGGPDSVALMALAADLRAVLPPLSVATVDHGLRPGSAEDAETVTALAGRFALPCRILRWTGSKPNSAIQERARRARYDLLAGYCREIGAHHLVTAHTVDDQAETVLMRLAHGSGVGGLGGMRPCTPRGDLSVLRPFLDVAKTRLVATCEARNLPVLTDPANSDSRYSRARLRGLAPQLAAEGLHAGQLATVARRAARAEAALEIMAEQAFADCCGPEEASLTLRAGRFASLSSELAVRVLARSVTAAVPEARLRLDALERAAERLQQALVIEAPRLSLTLGGARLLFAARTGTITVSCEPARRRGRGAPHAGVAPRLRPIVEQVASFPWQ